MVTRICILLLAVTALLPARAAAEQEVLTVATRQVAPFAMLGPDGRWEGLAITAWESAAKAEGLRFEYREMGLQEMLRALAEGEVDAAAAGLTITAERERQFDFTHPFLSSGLAIAVTRDEAPWLAALGRLLSGPFLRVTGALLALLLAVGVVVWLFERRGNPQFGGGPLRGIGSGLWWSAVTMTTVGYGDKAPQTFGGRLVALVWMFAGVIMISGFTAAIATTLTVGELGSRIESPADLQRVHSATVAGSTSERFLESLHLGYARFDHPAAALEALAAGQVQAVVYDAPALRYLAKNRYAGRATVVPGTFERQDYGIALPAGSPLREALNRHVPALLRSPGWQRALDAYLGAEP